MKFTKFDPEPYIKKALGTFASKKESIRDTGTNAYHGTPSQNNYCMSCGSKMEPGSRFCVNCGADMKYGGASITNQPHATTSSSPQMPPNSATSGISNGFGVNTIVDFFKKENKYVLILIGIVMAFWIGLFALVASSAGSSTSASSSEEKVEEETLATEENLTIDNDEDITETSSEEPVVSALTTEASTTVEDSIASDLVTGTDSETTDETEELSDETTESLSNTDDEPEEESVGEKVIIIANNVRVRPHPNTDGEPIGNLTFGDELYRHETLSNGWSLVDYNDQEAYIKSEFLGTESEYAALKEKKDNERVKAETAATTPTTGTQDVNIGAQDTSQLVPVAAEPVAAPTQNAGVLVWISDDGNRYHRKSSCSGMVNNVRQVTIEEAKAIGRTACGRCHPPE